MLNNIRISPHFKLLEFQCRGGSCCNFSVKIEAELLEKLEKLRVHLGEPIYLSSAYRCTKHNEEVGGAPNSFHIQGIAADIHTTHFDRNPLEIAKIAEKIGFTGIGIYEGYHNKYGFIHLDVRPLNEGQRVVRFGDWK